MKQNELTKTFIIKKKPLISMVSIPLYANIFNPYVLGMAKRNNYGTSLYHFIHKKVDFTFIILLAVVLSSVIIFHLSGIVSFVNNLLTQIVSYSFVR